MDKVYTLITHTNIIRGVSKVVHGEITKQGNLGKPKIAWYANIVKAIGRHAAFQFSSPVVMLVSQIKWVNVDSK